MSASNVAQTRGARASFQPLPVARATASLERSGSLDQAHRRARTKIAFHRAWRALHVNPGRVPARERSRPCVGTTLRTYATRPPAARPPRSPLSSPAGSSSLDRAFRPRPPPRRRAPSGSSDEPDMLHGPTRARALAPPGSPNARRQIRTPLSYTAPRPGVVPRCPPAPRRSVAGGRGHAGSPSEGSSLPALREKSPRAACVLPARLARRGPADCSRAAPAAPAWSARDRPSGASSVRRVRLLKVIPEPSASSSTSRS